MSVSTRQQRAQFASETLASLGQLVEDATAHFAMPGGVISVVDRGGILDELSFGLANVECSTPMDPRYRFEIGSISKLFTSLVVNRLVDEGRLDLDETLAQIFEWVDASSGLGRVSVRRLLNHTSGMSVGADTLADDAGEVWHSRHCVVAPDSPARFHYSNLGYLVLGEIVRERSGRRLAELVREQFLGPLKMDRALAEVSFADQASLATGYWPARPDRPWAPGDPLSPATFFEVDSASGNVAATSSDMAALVGALLGAATNDPVLDVEGRAVISRATFDRITQDLAPSGEPVYLAGGVRAVESSRYAMGINVEQVGAHRCVSHGGGMVGYSTFMLVDCTAELGVVVMTNANGDTLGAHLLARIVHDDVLRRLELAEPIARTSLDLSVRADNVAVHCVEPGTYWGDDFEESLEVLDARDGGAMHVRYRALEGRLFHLPNGRFVTEHPQLRRFHLDWSAHDASAGFTYGPTTFRRAEGRETNAASFSAPPHALVGHYRSFSPWYPEFRIIERSATLLLVAPGGVEAPSDEVVLVEVEPGVYRVGDDPWLPERLIAGPVRASQVVSVNRDGCLYSRVFSP